MDVIDQHDVPAAQAVGAMRIDRESPRNGLGALARVHRAQHGGRSRAAENLGIVRDAG
jgi:hypothetical protein